MDIPEKLMTHWWTQKRLVVPIVSTVSLVAFGLIVGVALIAARQPYDGFTWATLSGTVNEVAANSPASAAGIYPGDVIRTINNKPIEQAIADYATIPEGKPVTLLVLQGGQQRKIQLILSPPPQSEIFQRLIPLFVAFCFILFSFIVWACKPYDLTVILYLSINQLGATGLAFGVLSNLGFFWAIRWFGVILCMFSPLLIYFHLLFTHPNQFARRKQIMAALYMLALANALWRWSYPQPVNTLGYRMSRDISSIYFAATVLVSVILLTRAYFSSPSPSQQQRIRLVATGTSLAFAPLIGLALLPDIVSGTPTITYESTFPFLLLMPLAYGVAIYRHNLLNIDRLINRSVVHLTLLLILAAIYLALTAVITRVWQNSWVEQPFVWGMVMLLFAAIFAPLRNRLQIIVDHLFYGGWYDYRSVVSEMSQSLAKVTDSNEIAELLVTRLIAILRLDGAALILRNDERQLVLIKAMGCPPLPLHLQTSGQLAAKLFQVAQPLSASELNAALKDDELTEEEQSWLLDSELNMWIPLIRQKKLQGVLLLGNRLGGEPFDAEDRRALTTLSWGAAIAAENRRLVQSLRQRADEVNQLYSQLVQSREAERKRLARELHDRPIQNLINLHHYLNPTNLQLMSTAVENTQTLQERSQIIIDDLRQICTDLRPAALDDLSLGLAVQGYVEDIAEDKGISITLSWSGEKSFLSENLPEDVKVCLFRVLQEAVTNACRHTQFNHIQVRLAVMLDHVSLEVQDDGQGFQCPERLGILTRKGHFGLAGLQERVNLVGGTFQVKSASGQGTILRARVQLDNNVEENDRLD